MSEQIVWTPTETAILNVLGDSCPHKLEEIRDGYDKYIELSTIQNHLTNIRKKLGPIGQDIIFRDGRYRWVRIVGLGE